jgi:Tol biopolymer transport system component/DNA-binding winged helix-turn-helix (wHTH) protein
MSEETVRQGPIDLSRESDFSLGALQVSPSTREVIRGGEREMLEPRVMQVLVALALAGGRVVSRDELFLRCWEGRIVGEDAINRVIWRLRRLSEVDDGANFVIETIPKVGYRLQLPGGREASAAARPPITTDEPLSRAVRGDDAALEPHGKLFVRHRLVAAAVMVVVIAGATAWLLWPAPRWTVESSRPFVSTLELEGEPVFSPDGKMLAYISGPDAKSHKVYVRNLAGGDAIKITNDAYDDHNPSWSSDGAHIAYLAREAGGPCHIMVAAVPAGEAREVGRCRSAIAGSMAWQPNSSFLYFYDLRADGDSGISRLDLDSGARRDIVKEDARNLFVSPDAKSLAYLVGGRGEANAQLAVRDLTSGKEKILGNIRHSPLEGWISADAWSADSKTVFATASSGIGSEIIAFPVDGGAPYRIYASATGISRLSASAGGFLAIQSQVDRKNLARTSPMVIAQPDIIDPAGGLTISPTFAPDGTMAFVSDRSGTNAIWIKKPGADPVLLFDAGFAALSGGDFSPDGTRLAVMITPTTKLNGVTIKVLTADGASVASFDMPAGGLGWPTWTPDGKGLVVWDSRIRRAIRVDVADPARRAPVSPPDWQAVTIRRNGTFATRADKPGIWRIDNGIRLLNGKYPAIWGPPMAFLGDDVLIPDFRAAGGPRILAQPLAGGPDRVLAYAPGALGTDYQSRVAVNPKTGEIIYVATVQSDTNIDLLTLVKR